MPEFKGYKKGYTEKDFKEDNQTVKELGRYDWDRSSYRYANLKKKYQDALRRIQKQNEFNRKNGIALDSARLNAAGASTMRTPDVPESSKQTILDFLESRGWPAVQNFTDYEPDPDEPLAITIWKVQVAKPENVGEMQDWRRVRHDLWDLGKSLGLEPDSQTYLPGMGFWVNSSEEDYVPYDAAADSKQNVESKVYDLVSGVVENTLIAMMESELSVQSVTASIPDYDPDWCSDDYPPEIQERMDRAQEEIVNCCVELLMYDK